MIAATAGQELIIAAEGDRIYPVQVACEGLHLLGLKIPQTNAVVAAAADEELTIGAKGDRVYILAMA